MCGASSQGETVKTYDVNYGCRCCSLSNCKLIFLYFSESEVAKKLALSWSRARTDTDDKEKRKKKNNNDDVSHAKHNC